MRRYLAQFLSDPRVVQLPRLVWLPILHGIVLRTRPAKSAKKYASVWTPEGSPLAVHTRRQADLLLGLLQIEKITVAYAMRGSGPTNAQTPNVTIAAITTIGTNHAATRSASR